MEEVLNCVFLDRFLKAVKAPMEETGQKVCTLS